MNQNQETLGQYLKRERELRRTSIEEMALFVRVNRSFIEALEGDDFDVFADRHDCLHLIKQYTAYLKLNEMEALQLFDAQWKLTGGIKRYPKLTLFVDGNPVPVQSILFKGKGRLRLPWIVGALIVIAILLIDLPDMKRAMKSPDSRPPLANGIDTLPGRNGIPPSEAKTQRQIASLQLIVPLPTPPSRKVGTESNSAPRQQQSASSKPIVAPNTPPTRTHVSLSDENRLQRSAPPPARTRVADEKIPPRPKSIVVVANRDSKRYHLPGMKYYDLVKAYHRVVFQSEKEAIRAGYRKARE